MGKLARSGSRRALALRLYRHFARESKHLGSNHEWLKPIPLRRDQAFALPFTVQPARFLRSLRPCTAIRFEANSSAFCHPQRLCGLA